MLLGPILGIRAIADRRHRGGGGGGGTGGSGCARGVVKRGPQGRLLFLPVPAPLPGLRENEPGQRGRRHDAEEDPLDAVRQVRAGLERRQGNGAQAAGLIRRELNVVLVQVQAHDLADLVGVEAVHLGRLARPARQRRALGGHFAAARVPEDCYLARRSLVHRGNAAIGGGLETAIDQVNRAIVGPEGGQRMGGRGAVDRAVAQQDVRIRQELALRRDPPPLRAVLQLAVGGEEFRGVHGIDLECMAQLIVALLRGLVLPELPRGEHREREVGERDADHGGEHPAGRDELADSGFHAAHLTHPPGLAPRWKGEGPRVARRGSGMRR